MSLFVEPSTEVSPSRQSSDMKILVPPNRRHPSSQLAALGRLASTSAEPWSPSSTVRSTPPLDFHQASPPSSLSSLGSSTKFDGIVTTSNVLTHEVAALVHLHPANHRATHLRLLSFWQRSIAYVKGMRLLRRGATGTSALRGSSVHCDGHPGTSRDEREQAWPLSRHTGPLSSHLATTLRKESFTDDTPTSSSPATVANIEQLESSFDVEVGGGRAFSGGLEDGSEQECAAHGLVLPCPPSDEEKTIYRKTHRSMILLCGIIAFCALEGGMWMCTLASPYMYWFGVPAVFMIFYFGCYFSLAVRGTDFDPEAHAQIVRKSVENAYLPTVDVFLPVCNEPIALFANTWKHVAALEYPHVTVHVLDDGDKDSVRHLAEKFGFQYIQRVNRELKKAGNLRHAFARTSGEAVVIFDADFCPRPDFLRETIPYLLDPSVGILQTPQFFRWKQEQTWVEQGAGINQEFFYRMDQVNRNGFTAPVCVGTCAVYRRTAVEPFGGVAAIEHSEDIYTGYKIAELGFQVKYLPLCLAMGICPDEPRSFFTQQYRWCMGTLSLVLQKDFWKSSTSNIHKLSFLVGMLYYLVTAVFVFLAPLPVLILIWFKPDGVIWYHTAFVVPSIVLATIGVPYWSKSVRSTRVEGRLSRTLSCYRVKIIQSYAHAYAIKDRIMGTATPWVPSGSGASRSSCQAYNSSVRLLLAWNIVTTSAILGGAALRMTEFPPYQFVPAVTLVVSATILSVSTLWY